MARDGQYLGRVSLVVFPSGGDGEHFKFSIGLGVPRAQKKGPAVSRAKVYKGKTSGRGEP